MYESLPEKLGLSREELTQIKEESRFISLSKKEIKIVNRYTALMQ